MPRAGDDAGQQSDHVGDSAASLPTSTGSPSPPLPPVSPSPPPPPPEPSMSARHQQLLALRLKMNAGRRENARSAKEEMERVAGKRDTTHSTASKHKQQQQSGQAAERNDPVIAALLHDPVDSADVRWKEQKVKQRRKKGYASDEVDDDEERKEGGTNEAARRRVSELSSHNVFNPQTAHRQYERNLLHAQQQQRVHTHKQHSAADVPTAGGSSSPSSSLTLSSATADPYIGRATPSSTAVDRLVADMDAAAKRRAAFSRRRRFNDEEDVSYINERNRTFNKKVARAFDAYTIDIAQSLERGTAL